MTKVISKSGKFSMALATSFVLGGCGGSNVGTAEALARDAEAMVERFDGYGLTPPEDMPTAGRATYRGFSFVIADVSPAEEFAALGRATLNADFGAGTVDGQLSGFLDEQNNRVAGAIAVENGLISGSEVTDLTMTGTVSTSAGVGSIDADGVGVFFGPSVEGLEVLGSGSIDYGTGFVGEALVGAIAER